MKGNHPPDPAIVIHCVQRKAATITQKTVPVYPRVAYLDKYPAQTLVPMSISTEGASIVRSVASSSSIASDFPVTLSFASWLSNTTINR